MHFVRLMVDIQRFEEETKKLNDADLKTFSDIPRIVTKAGEVWVSESDLPAVKNFVGSAITRVYGFDYQDRSQIRFSPDTRGAIPILIDLVREIAVLVGYKVVRVCTSKSYDDLALEERGDPENLFIILNALPSEIDGGNKRSIDTLRFGLITTKVPRSISSSFLGLDKARDTKWSNKVIRDDLGHGLAVHSGNKIWVAFNLAGGGGGFDQEWYPTLAAREILARSLASQATETDKPVEQVDRMKALETCRKDFIQHCKTDVKEHKRELETQLQTQNDRILTLQKELAVAEALIRDNRRLLDAFVNPDGKDGVLSKEFDLIKEHIPLLRSLKFTGNGLTFETEVVHLEGDTATYDPQKFDPFPLGRYEVQLVRGSSVHVTNLTNRLQYRFDGATHWWDHPHVQDHRPCLGNISGEVAKLVRQDKWFGAITYMIEALKSFNSHDGWSPIGLPLWQRAAEEAIAPVVFDDDKKDRIKNWVSYRHRLPLGLNATIGDEVVADCPDTCPLIKDNICTLKGTGTRTGKVFGFYEDHIQVEWKAPNGKKIACTGFTYNSVKNPDGSPIMDVIGEAEPGKMIQAELDPRDFDPGIVTHDARETLPNHLGGFTFKRDEKGKQWIGRDVADTKIAITDETVRTLGLNGVAGLLAKLTGNIIDFKDEYPDGTNEEFHAWMNENERNVPVPIGEPYGVVNILHPLVNRDHLIDIDIIERIEGMAKAQENAVPLPKIHLEAEDVPDTNPDKIWDNDTEELTPEDNDIMEAFHEGVEFDMDF